MEKSDHSTLAVGLATWLELERTSLAGHHKLIPSMNQYDFGNAKTAQILDQTKVVNMLTL